MSEEPFPHLSGRVRSRCLRLVGFVMMRGAESGSLPA